MRRGWIKFAGVGFSQAGDIARVLDASRLHAETNPEIWDLVLARVADGLQHAFDSAFTETSGNENAVIIGQLLLAGPLSRFQSLSFNPVQRQLQVVRKRAMDQRFLQ